MYEFEVECPDCGWFNEIVTEEESVVSWTCEVCQAQPTTCFPTDGEGNLL